MSCRCLPPDWAGTATAGLAPLSFLLLLPRDFCRGRCPARLASTRGGMGARQGASARRPGHSRGGGCNRGLCAEKWGTLSPQLFPSTPSSPCLETLVTSPVAQSLRVEASPRKQKQSQNASSPLVPPPARCSPTVSPPFPSPPPHLAAGTAIHPPSPPTHPGGSLGAQGRSPGAGVSREQGLGDNSSVRGDGAGENPQVHQSSGRTREVSARGE